jgi:L-aspartate oxidase
VVGAGVRRPDAGPGRRLQASRAAGGDDLPGGRAPLRSADGLRSGLDSLEALAGARADSVDQRAWETTNLHTVGTLLAGAALLREETRGSHWREDFPERDDAEQSGHHDWWLAGQEPRHEFRPAGPTDAPIEAPIDDRVEVR